MKDDRIYLTHMLECIGRIEEYTKGGHSAFKQSQLIQDGVIRNLQTLGQSAIKLSAALKTSNSSIDWKGIIGFRNVLVHDYLGVNIARVWEIVEGELLSLKDAITRILEK